MSKTRSKNILSIFSTYSFCFPQEMYGDLWVANEGELDRESSIYVSIPVNKVSFKYIDLKSNNNPPPTKDLSQVEN